MKSLGVKVEPWRVLACDPGFERLGVAVLEKNYSTNSKQEKFLYSDCIRTDAALPFHRRLQIIGSAVELLLKEWRPDAVALEDVYFAKNEKTAMKIAEVRGMLTYLAVLQGLPLFEYSPAEVKAAVTGYGKGDKRAVAVMVPKLIALPQKKRLDDELDAIAVGLTCLASARF